MRHTSTRIAGLAGRIAAGVIALSALCAVSATAGASPLGVWMEQSERAAIEVSECGGGLCGRIVWLRDQTDKAGCNVQVFGNVQPIGSAKWDRGWIINPEQSLSTKYDVEITLISSQKLKVMGYMGMKFLSETRIWTRASAELPRCGEAAPIPVRLPSEAEPRPVDPPAVEPAPPPAVEPPTYAEPRPLEAPAAKPAPERPRVAQKGGKECGFSFGSLKMSFPCDDDD